MLITLAGAFATLLFIWGNSLVPPQQSGEVSGWVRDFLQGVLGFFFGPVVLPQLLIRKLAHFTAFALLAAWLAGFLMARKRVSLQGGVNCLFFALAAAVTDEALQLIPGRGSSVLDVLLDFSGALFGLLLALFVRFIVLRVRAKRALRRKQKEGVPGETLSHNV